MITTPVDGTLRGTPRPMITLSAQNYVRLHFRRLSPEANEFSYET
jgi:hypothetical protein